MLKVDKSIVLWYNGSIDCLESGNCAANLVIRARRRTRDEVLLPDSIRGCSYRFNL